ncbi:N-acetyl-gamma-glutamyl-phosphate reductase [Alphaproteobacteria bacterium]|nr:N-acetyl-gamma-glutamyl-phosphate reductase [Alphaproteobacteria bacterium]
MSKKVSVAILGSTGYVGIELVKILSKHPNIDIVFLGTEKSPNISIQKLDSSIDISNIPNTQLNRDFDYNIADTVFLALPHSVSNEYVKLFYNKIQIIDLSADFRLDNFEIYKKNYATKHSCPGLLGEFIYGLPEFNKNEIANSKNIAVPGCYPTSILIPTLPLLSNNLIKDSNLIFDSKSGYSGAGKNFDKGNIENSNDYNFFNYNTNQHRHISEIRQELEKINKGEVLFSFNPHILPNFRGMMSTIYCDLNDGIKESDIIKCFEQLDSQNYFINFIDDQRADFFLVQNTNKCVLKIFKHYDDSKIILVSLIDNLQKGAAGQAVQCFNLSKGFDESSGLIK